MTDSVHGTTVPGQVTVVEISADRVQGVNIVNRSLTGELWVRFDGEDPVVEGEGSFAVLGARNYPYPKTTAGEGVEIKLISDDAVKFSVEGSPSWGEADDA